VAGRPFLNFFTAVKIASVEVLKICTEMRVKYMQKKQRMLQVK